MIIWKFAIYLGVLTLLFALFVSVIALARFGRGHQEDDRVSGAPSHRGMSGRLSG